MTISVFEQCVAVFDPALLGHLTTQYPWSQNESKVSSEEINQALLSPLDLIQPGHFTDDPFEHDKVDNFSASRDEHIRRIGWFVKNWNPSINHALLASMTGPNHFEFKDGNHRMHAAYHRREKEISIKFEFGNCADIENHDGFLRWVSKPSHNGVFGVSIVSSADMGCEVLFDGINRFWINDAEMGMCICSLKEKMILQRSFRDGNTIPSLTGKNATVEEMVESMFSIYPDFEVSRDKVTQSIIDLRLCTSY
ncbi:hypothetical protein R7D97_16020 [Vibrio sp. Vb5031]|uniref:Uncharacterized protein n=2 Tax=Vibrio TaxID=662 RepID=A0A1B1LR63_VIBPH|nr:MULTISPECIES: hypothetical protein [Vibrio]ANS55519.1 hypothetical protein [Vibrio parahaemolyticus]EJL6492817.1 hypothetical protein [Vibrio cholerae]EJL6644444.1 hypothetical protein [Vibrio cholerae]MBL4244475.1 hypothetical protein [Vibrio fluvialis]MBL4253365.1 hypothetical protein [Vibrio fluvialis]